MISGSLEIERSSSSGSHLKGGSSRSEGKSTLFVVRCDMPEAMLGAVTDGGGLYVHSGGLLQEGGNIKLRSSHSNEGRGGGLMIADGGLRQLAGDISCQNCSAKTGGCLAVGSRARVTAGVHLRGSIVARNCVATAGHEREWRGLAYSN